MKTNILILMSIEILFCLCSCIQTIITPTATGPDVYVAGTQTVGAVTNAVLWKNGVVSNITNGTNNISVSGLHVTPNGDVYVSGYKTIGTHTTAKYWKNGVATTLYSNVGASDTKTTGIYVSGNGGDVYISGEETFVNSSTGVSRNVPKYWREFRNSNGALTGTSGIFLGNSYFGTTSAHTSGIALLGSDIYVVGWEEEVYGNLTTPKLWKNNDLPTTLGSANANHHAKTKNIAIFGNDIYVAGSENENSLSPTSATIWKNGAIALSVGSGTNAAIANSVIYSGGVMRFCGFTSNAAGTYPNAYTFGPGFTNLNTNNNVNGEALDMKITSAGDIYVVGYEGNIAKMWKNGVASDPFGGTGNSVAKAIVVF